MEEDKTLHDLQAIWGMVGLTLTQAIDHLEACIGPVMIASDLNHLGTSLKDNLVNLVATPLAHALHLVGANFNQLSSKRQRRLLKDIQDPQLVKWLEDSKEPVMSLFPGDITTALEVAHVHCMDGSISMASRAARAFTSIVSTARGTCYEPSTAPKQPFHRGASPFQPSGVPVASVLLLWPWSIISLFQYLPFQPENFPLSSLCPLCHILRQVDDCLIFSLLGKL